MLILKIYAWSAVDLFCTNLNHIVPLPYNKCFDTAAYSSAKTLGPSTLIPVNKQPTWKNPIIKIIKTKGIQLSLEVISLLCQIPSQDPSKKILALIVND